MKLHQLDFTVNYAGGRGCPDVEGAFGMPPAQGRPQVTRQCAGAGFESAPTHGSVSKTIANGYKEIGRKFLIIRRLLGVSNVLE
jgi:hypothetical protein